VYCTDHIPPTHRVIFFLMSRHGCHTMLQHPPLACAYAELLVSSPPCTLTQPRRSQALTTSTVSHTTLPTRLRVALVVRRPPPQAGFYEQLDCFCCNLCRLLYLLLYGGQNNMHKSKPVRLFPYACLFPFSLRNFVWHLLAIDRVQLGDTMLSCLLS
jgi:hypothetical protein